MTDEQLERAAVDIDSFTADVRALIRLTTEERRALRDRTDLEIQLARTVDADDRWYEQHDAWVR